MGWPSINSCPLESWVTLNKVLIIELLPAPVLPTIPIFSPALILTVISLSTSGKSSRYLDDIFLNSISPLVITCWYPSYLADHLLQYSR